MMSHVLLRQKILIILHNVAVTKWLNLSPAVACSVEEAALAVGTLWDMRVSSLRP